MLTDGLLALLDGTVVLTLTQVTTLLVGHHVEGDHLRIVVLVALLFLQIAVDEGLRTVIIGIIAGVERMPPSGATRVFLRRTSCERQREQQQHRQFFTFFLFYLFTFFYQTVYLAVALVGFGAGRTVVPLDNGILTLVEVVGHQGNHPQHHDHPYAHNGERHFFTFLPFYLFTFPQPQTQLVSGRPNSADTTWSPPEGY